MKKTYSILFFIATLSILIGCTKSDVLTQKSNYIEISNSKYDLSKGYLVSYPTIIDNKINDLKTQMNYEVKLAGSNSTAVSIIKGQYQAKMDEWASKKTKGIGLFVILLTSSEIAIELNNNNFSKLSGKGNVVLLALWASNSTKLDNGAYKLSDPQIRFTAELANKNVSEMAIYLINLDTVADKEQLSGDFENGLITVDNNTISVESNSAKLGKQYLKFDKPLITITDTNFEIY
jgi:major membrane immunogen (membrane-anchored lipoprotein)